MGGVDDVDEVAWALVGTYHGRDVLQWVGYGDNDYDGVDGVVVGLVLLWWLKCC